MRNFIGKGNLTLFIGVVEDRDDPVQLGRVRVRCYGWHTDDKGQIPTEQLPWAVPINPIQSASVSGVGYSPTGLVEGSWVVGFFIDGERAQEPMILGSLYGVPSSIADPDLGFNDPTGAYPRFINESDVTRAARDDNDAPLQHNSRIVKKDLRLNPDGTAKQYYTATPPRISTVATDRDDSYYANTSWIEPEVSGNTLPDYPFNHVRETESGHLEEFDDTDGARRYHRFHPSGSFEEVLDDGSRIIKVVGDSYEMFLDGKNIYVDGNINMTVTGDKRELIQGNYHLEVEGDMTMDLKQSWQTKVGFNQETEIGRGRSTNIAQSDNLTIVKGDQNLNIVTGSRTENIANSDVKIVQGKLSSTAYGDYSVFTSGNYSQTNLKNLTETSKGNIVRKTNANATITVVGTMTETADTGNVTYTSGDVSANGISLVTHIHGDVASGIAKTGEPE